ncbi:hypothetical protein CYMTET_18178 [Cymbomonas tetramitiformis]|uniref:LysM domain-containing protein n=1 Tax=Cymbomonas tetramitiformis TaxID=36881 RepID=A0AAE0L6J7_9CHLO|nr:hypothetical protein CYMTET_18178 [Cymbomonas tetramitiformis]
MVDHSQLKRLQSEVEALQKYPSGEVTGTLMYLKPVDMVEFREGLYQSWVMKGGQDQPPLELVKLEAKGPIKFYSVDDGLGGGAVFTDNASAQEYLHLEEGRRMLRRADTEELGYAAIDAPGRRRSPPPLRKTATAAVAGASSAGAGPSGTKSSVREALTYGRALARFQLGECYAQRGLADHHNVSVSMAGRHNKTITCAKNGWHLPLGGQTRSRDLRGAIGLAYSDLIDPGPERQRSFRCVTLLEYSVGTNATHVLRCLENPNAKPVYYIFEDNNRHESGIFQFKDEYLQDERRKFTRLAYVTSAEGAPWVRPALILLERRLRSPEAIVEQVRHARVAHRSEHNDEEMADARTLDREAGKCFGNDLSARALAVSKAAERASGPHTLFGAKSHDAISDKGKAVLAKEARDNLKREINNPTKWGSALAKGGISFKQANIFAKEVLPKGAKPANNKITQSNKTILEVMERLLPITETASGGGYQVNVQKFFSLILPTYYRRLKEKMFPPTLLETLDPETDEYMHRDLFEHEKELLRDAICDWDFSFDAASSKTRKVTFTSFVVSPKIEGLEEEWQSPKSCYNVLQLDGKDKAENLELNCLELFDLVQELEDNTPVTCWLEGEEVELVIRLHYPADMASHWAWMRAGGGTHDEADFCHRCKCKGKEKGHVFDTYCIQAGDTTQSIADAHDIFAAELRLINPKDKTMEAKLKDLHCNKQRKFTPQLTTFPEDTMALLPVGKKIRVHKQWPMDRVCPDAFVKFPHIKAMFCWLHAGMRVTEFLVTKLQQRAVHHKLVDALNAAWMDEGYKTYYQMKKSPETGEYYKASFNGIQVKRMIQHAQHWAAVVDDREAILALFQEWKDIYEVGRKLCPSASEMADFGKRCRTFFRCVRMAYTDENIAMYLHAVGCHAGDYMRVEPLGKHMNEHLEAHHIITWQYYRHGFRGGTPGNPYAVKNEDGTFKGGERTHTHQSQNVCKSILETQNRLLFLDIAKDWDESVWSAVGLTKPPEATDMAEFFKQEAPKAQLVPATQALRRTKRKIEKTEEECRNVKRTLAADHPTVLRVQHRLDSLKKSLLPRKKSIVASLVEKAKKIARKAHLHDR